MNQLPPIRKYSISKDDRVIYLAIEVRLVEVEPYGLLVEELRDRGVHHTIFFEHVPALLEAKKLRVDRAYYAKPSVKLRAEDKSSLPNDLEESKRIDLSFKFGLIITWRSYIKTLSAETKDKAQVAYDAVYGPYVLRHLKEDTPSRLAKGGPIPFSTFMGWNRRLKAYGDDIRCLIDGRKGNPTLRLEATVEGFLQAELLNYLTPDGPIPARLLSEIRGKIEDINEGRMAEGRTDLLVVPSHRTLGRRIEKMDKWLVDAARLTPDIADKNYRISMDGLPSTRPGERVEIDGWVSDLHTLLGETDAWMNLPPNIRAQLKSVRITFIFAIDSVTRCIVGISFSWSENSDAISACVRMAMEDKTELARIYRCKSTWPMYAWHRFIHDMHPAYDAIEVQKAVLRGLGNAQHTPAGVPWLKGRIERFFRTIATKLIGFFRGQTGSKPKERTQYQQQAYATITYEELIGLVIVWIVDSYHHDEHTGLGGITPFQAWHHFSLQAPPAVGLNPVQLLELHGRVIELPANGSGITMAGTTFNSNELQILLRKVGFGNIKVKVDELNLGQIQVPVPERFLRDKTFNGEGWITIEAPTQLNGISYRQIELADEDLMVRYGCDTPTTEKINREAIKSIAAAAREAARARLTEPQVDLEKLQQRMNRTFHPALRFNDQQHTAKLDALHEPILLPGARQTAPPKLTKAEPAAVSFKFKD